MGQTARSKLLKYGPATINPFSANSYTVDGLRIDSSAEIEASFFQPFLSAAGVYGVGEVDNGDPKYVCPYQNYIDGVLNYPA